MIRKCSHYAINTISHYRIAIIALIAKWEPSFKEQKWNEDMQNVLKDQMEFLKGEIVVKNSLIESLLVELYKKNSTSDYEQDELNTMKSLSSINNMNITSS